MIKKQNLNILKTENFDDLLDFWQKKKSPCDENFLEKTVVLDRLIIMDDISGFADRSEAFANILTVSKKSGLTYVYIFHKIYPRRQDWQMIL